MVASGYVRKVSEVDFDALRGKVPLLDALDIELTERCNNRCIHCLINRPADDPATASREMTTNFVLDILSQAADLGCMTVRFTGGEPLLRPDFPQIYLSARKLGMKVLLFTNARLITPDIASLFSQVPPGKPVDISVYGMCASSYDAVAGVRGAYDEFCRGIECLRDHNIPFTVKWAILPPNREEFTEFELWASRIRYMTDPPVCTVNYDLRARRDDCAKNARIRALRLTPEETVTILSNRPGYLEGMREFCGKFLHPHGDRLFVCGAGRSIAVDSFGMVQMCLMLRHPETVLDLHQIQLEEVLRTIFPSMRRLRAMESDYLRRCACCFIKALCGQCPAKSWMEHGSLDSPVEYFCDVAHERARALGLLKKGEKAWDVTDWSTRVARFSNGTRSSK